MGWSEALIAVEIIRRYSRGIGFSSWLRVSGMPGHSRSTISRTRRSWVGLTIDQKRHTAMASTPHFFRCRTAATTSPSSSFSRSWPSASMRPRTSQVRLRATNGGGKLIWVVKARLRGDSRRVSTSGWPALQIRPTEATLPSIRALVETVVPWTIRSTLSRNPPSGRPCASAASRKESMKPRSNSPGVVGDLKISRPFSSEKSTRSVKVPPMSTQATTISTFLLVRQAKGGGGRRPGGAEEDGADFEIADQALAPENEDQQQDRGEADLLQARRSREDEGAKIDAALDAAEDLGDDG